MKLARLPVMQNSLVSGFGLLALLAAAAALGPTGHAAEPSPQPTGERVLAELKMEGERGPDFAGPVCVSVSWNGKPGLVMLDTGCSTSVLDRRFFPHLRSAGNDATGETPCGEISFLRIYDPPDLPVGPCSLARGGSVICRDLSDFTSGGRRIIAVVGISALQFYVTQFDFDARVVRFYETDDDAHSSWGTPLSLKWLRGVEAVRASLADREADFVVDTGAVGAELDAPTESFEELLKAVGRPTVTERWLCLEGTADSRCMRLPEFKLPSMKYRGLLLKETKSSTGALGCGFLARHLVTLDVLHDRLYLKPGRQFARQAELGMSGLHILSSDSRVVADSVDPGTPAYEAGMRDGDVLLTVNGAAAHERDIDELRRLLKSESGREITVTYLRADKATTVKFRLRRRI